MSTTRPAPLRHRRVLTVPPSRLRCTGCSSSSSVPKPRPAAAKGRRLVRGHPACPRTSLLTTRSAHAQRRHVQPAHSHRTDAGDVPSPQPPKPRSVTFRGCRVEPAPLRTRRRPGHQSPGAPWGPGCRPTTLRLRNETSNEPAADQTACSRWRPWSRSGGCWRSPGRRRGQRQSGRRTVTRRAAQQNRGEGGEEEWACRHRWARITPAGCAADDRPQPMADTLMTPVPPELQRAGCSPGRIFVSVPTVVLRGRLGS